MAASGCLSDWEHLQTSLLLTLYVVLDYHATLSSLFYLFWIYMSQFKAYPKSGPIIWVRPGTPRPGTLKVRPETRDPSHRWDPGLETQDSYFTWDSRPEAQDTERETWDTYDEWDRRSKIYIPCRTLDARTMI